MKLTAIEIHPSGSSEYAELSFRDPGSTNEFVVKGITGLDADNIVPRYYKGSGSNNFVNMSLENREVVFLIGLNPNFQAYKTYSDLRDKLYRSIASSRTGKVQIQFKNGSDIVAELNGHVLKFETGLFNKTQEVQLTIKCDDTVLRAVDPVFIELGG